MSINFAPSNLETTPYDGQGMTIHDIARLRAQEVDTAPEVTQPQQETNPELSLDSQVANTLDVLEEMRRQQTMKLVELRGSSSGIVDVDKLRTSMDDQVDTFLQTRFGLTPDTPGYDDLRKVSREASIDNHPSMTWNVGGRNADGIREKSGRDQVRQSVVELFTPAPTITPEQTVPAESKSKTELALITLHESPEFTAAVDELDGSREKLATLTAKQLGKPVDFSGKYQRARAEYNDALRQVGRLEEQARNGADSNRNDKQKIVDFVQYVMVEQTKLRDMTRELFAQTKVSKFIDWFNNGGHMSRLAKGFAGTFAGEYVREYVHNDQDRGIPTAQDRISVDDLKQHLAYEGATLENATAYADATFDRDKKHEQEKRRKAAVRSLAAAAVGSIVDR